MDSLPQEIIDEIIDNLPRSTLRSSSLVAKRWRRRSQRRVLSKVTLSSESDVNKWHVDTQEDPGRIPSYVQTAKFNHITRWNDPALFSRVLKNFSSLMRLWTYETEFPEEVLEYISNGGLGKNIIGLSLWSPRCSLTTAISMILTFPKLRNLVVDTFTTASTKALPAHSIMPQRRPLDSLQVVRNVAGVVQTLANLQFTSRRLILDVQTTNIHKLLILSSVTVVELVLLGACSLWGDRKHISDDFIDDPDRQSPHLLDISPFPALNSLKIHICGCYPSPQLVNTLSSISSAPALASIDLECWWWFLSGSVPSGTWDRLDTWLARMAENAIVEGGPVLTLARWEDNQGSRALFPKFKEVSKIKTDPEGLDV